MAHTLLRLLLLVAPPTPPLCCWLPLPSSPPITAHALTPLDSLAWPTFSQDYPQLLAGTATVAGFRRKWYASNFLLWSQTAFPVVLGKQRSGSQPVVVATRHEGGRVVAFGHEAPLTGCCKAKDAVDQLVQNAARWVGNAAARRTPARVAALSSDYGQLLKALAGLKTDSGAAVFALAGEAGVVDLADFADAGGASTNVDVYIVDTYSEYSQAQVDVIIDWVVGGGGLIVAGHAWSWADDHPGANPLTDLSVNKLLWPLGMAVLVQNQYGFAPPTTSQSKPEVVQAQARYLMYNALLAQARVNLASKPEGSAAYLPLPANAGDAVFSTLRLALQVLPARGVEPYETDVWQVLDGITDASSGQQAPVAVGPDQPVGMGISTPGAYIQVLMQARAVVGGQAVVSPSAALFPGAPSGPGSGPGGPVTIAVNATYEGLVPELPGGRDEPVWRSLGLYAPPGATITITLPQAAAGKGLRLQIGAHTDTLYSKPKWYRVPEIVNSFDLATNTTTGANPMGGLIFVVVPVGTALGSVQVSVSGAVRAPQFVLGATTPSQWAEARAAPGPWAELHSAGITLMVPAQAVRAMADPGPLMQFWQQVAAGYRDLLGLPLAWPRTNRLLVDVQIAYGYLHAGYPVMGPLGAGDVMLNATLLRTEGSWGWFHELGHQHEWAPAMLPGADEAFCNIFTTYTMETVVGIPIQQQSENTIETQRAQQREEYIKNGRNFAKDWNYFVALDTYLQLREAFGWGFYKSVFRAYTGAQGKYTDLDADGKVQLWVITTSNAAGFNLVPFYDSWGFPVGDETRKQLGSLPEWADNPMPPV